MLKWLFRWDTLITLFFGLVCLIFTAILIIDIIRKIIRKKPLEPTGCIGLLLFPLFLALFGWGSYDLINNFIVAKNSIEFYKESKDAKETYHKYIDKNDVEGIGKTIVKLSSPDSEKLLIDILNLSNNRKLAVVMLNSGNLQLINGAESWAKNNGYKVQTVRYSTGTPRWK